MHDIDVENAAAACEADAGHTLPGLREALNQMKRNEFAAVHTPEQIKARIAAREGWDG